MIAWLRGAFSGGAFSGGAFSGGAFDGRSSGEDADAAVTRGMVDVLAALDHVIDDDAALRRVHAGLSENVGPARARGSAVPRRRRVLLRLGLRPAVGVATALAAGAVALAVTEVPGLVRGGTQGGAVDTAYVLKQVDSALQAAGPGEIAQMTVTTHPMAAGRTSGPPGVSHEAAGPMVTAEEWSYGDQWRFAGDGTSATPILDMGYSPSAGYTEVSYKQRAWARSRDLSLPPGGLAGSPKSQPVPVSGAPVSGAPGSGAPAGAPSSGAPGSGAPGSGAPGSGAPGCGRQAVSDLSWLLHPGLVGVMNGTTATLLPGTVASTLRNAVSCGTLAVTGRQPIDGIEVIELTSRPGSAINETVWVDPATYLPVRINVDLAPGAPTWQTVNITWLPATAQNLAKLIVPVPAGFSHIPAAEIRPTVSNAPPNSK
jgi:hypothetical protein